MTEVWANFDTCLHPRLWLLSIAVLLWCNYEIKLLYYPFSPTYLHAQLPSNNNQSMSLELIMLYTIIILPSSHGTLVSVSWYIMMISVHRVQSKNHTSSIELRVTIHTSPYVKSFIQNIPHENYYASTHYCLLYQLQ